MNPPHPIHSTDPDVCCRWLAMSAGRRTGQDHEEVARALEALPFANGPVRRSEFPLDPSQIWRRA